MKCIKVSTCMKCPYFEHSLDICRGHIFVCNHPRFDNSINFAIGSDCMKYWGGNNFPDICPLENLELR
jgi:hypothetical protein